VATASARGVGRSEAARPRRDVGSPDGIGDGPGTRERVGLRRAAGAAGGMPVTEAEWLNAIDPKPMLEYLRDKVSDRKLRLFACACAAAPTPLRRRTAPGR
jgi:hypothetical protein